MYEILQNRAVIQITGHDTIQFLHSLITNDIKANKYCYTYILSNQGKYLFDCFILKISNINVLIDIDINQACLFIEYLMKYKLSSNIQINDFTSIYVVIYSEQKYKINSYRDTRYAELGFRSIVPKNFIIDNKVFGLYLKHKYQFVIVDGYDDLIFNRSIPLEYGCDKLNAISYTKGCYIGQEIIARTKYQGTIRKKIFKLILNTDGLNISKHSSVMVDNVKVGIVCSYYNNNIIALLRTGNYLTSSNIIITINDRFATLISPPWD